MLERTLFVSSPRVRIMSDSPMKLLTYVLVVGGIIAVALPGLMDSMTVQEGTPQAVSQPASQPIRTAAVRAPARAATGFGAVALDADAAGHYHARIEIDGQTIPMLVDTGASVVALRFEDASNLGINPMPDEFNIKLSTANGEIQAARVRLREVRLENITVSDVDAVVLPSGALGQSLLGISFLKKLASFEIASGQLLLRP
ncbi:MAG: TIGR02281 family clan AA aspartic protease [Alphaproteobacteria bacterium]|nr:TIGR02281 family clan AA aspartic protease [Alphaproteobacteria bacterium]